MSAPRHYKSSDLGLDVEIDKLTNSIEEVATGHVLETLVLEMATPGAPTIRKRDYGFDWSQELAVPNRSVYGLVTVNQPLLLQGLISMENRTDHMYIPAVESSRVNQGKGKIYLGIPGNLFAFVCRESLVAGYDGVVSFVAKTRLIEHYQKTLGARVIRGARMTIDPPVALDLINRYFPTR